LGGASGLDSRLDGAQQFFTSSGPGQFRDFVREAQMICVAQGMRAGKMPMGSVSVRPPTSERRQHDDPALGGATLKLAERSLIY
jgi:hypothetical protein